MAPEGSSTSTLLDGRTRERLEDLGISGLDMERFATEYLRQGGDLDSDAFVAWAGKKMDEDPYRVRDKHIEDQNPLP